jgi:imidazolonepropionase-like amidohydrolase
MRGGRLLTVTQGTIEDGVLIFEDGRITAVGAGIAIPATARVIDVTGKIIMPGLIDGFTNLGTADYPSLGRDDDEATDPTTPHLRITDGLNPDNRFIPMARAAGVTAVLAAPAEGNLITGQSGLVQLAGETMEEMVLRSPVGIHVSLGEAPKLRYGGRNQAPMTRMGAAALLRQTLVDVLAYGERIAQHQRKLAAYRAGDAEKEPSPLARNLELEALLPVIRGEKPLIVSADRFDDIHTALRIAAEFDVPIVLNHGAEAHRLAAELADRDVPVIWGPLSAPYRELEARGGTPETPRMLEEAGVLFGFQTGSVENVTGLLEQARAAVRYGLPRDEALKALTLNPARIFGVGDEVGSLEVGKSADLVVFDRDPLEGLARVEMVFVRGRQFAGNQ